MPRKIIKRFLPDHEAIKQHKHLQIFGTLLHDPNLWHLNRRSVSSAFAVGLFVAWMPIPFQMLMAAAGAIVFRTNLPLAVVLCWTSNPVTIPPLFYFAYKLGALILNIPPGEFTFEPSWEWLMGEMLVIWKPFLLGCGVMAALSSMGGYVSVNWAWRWYQKRQWRKRQKIRINSLNNK